MMSLSTPMGRSFGSILGGFVYEPAAARLGKIPCWHDVFFSTFVFCEKVFLIPTLVFQEPDLLDQLVLLS